MKQRRGLLLILLAAALLSAFFAGLGTWQLQRMEWKRALIARIEARAHAAPASAPAAQAWPAIQAAPLDYEYRRVRLQGRFLHSRETLVQATTELGAGFWVLTPLRQAGGEIVLVNRGFVPPALRDPATRTAGATAGEVEIIGLLRVTEPGGGFLRDNDPANGRWYSRDVAAIVAALGLPAGQVAPYFIDAQAGPPGQHPVGGLTVLHLRDTHLVYALTWYALALMVAAGAAFAGWQTVTSSPLASRGPRALPDGIRGRPACADNLRNSL